MPSGIPGYSVSIAHRSPNQSASPTFTEYGPIHADGLSWAEELNRDGEHTASTTPDVLPQDVLDHVEEELDNDSDVPGLELWIRRSDGEGGSDLVAQGPILGIQVQGEQPTWTFRAVGPLYYARYMYLRAAATLIFSGVDQHTIAQTLIEDWQDLDWGDFGIDTSQVSASGTTRDRTYTPGDYVHQRLIELAEVDGGFDVWVNADRELMLGTKGSDLTGSVVLDRRGIRNAAMAISFAAGDLASEALAKNNDEDPLTSEQSNTALRESFGRAGVSSSFDVTTQGTLDDHATLLLDSRARPLVDPQPDLIPVAGAGVMDFGSGDTVQFAPKIGIENLILERRVLRKQVSVSGRGEESIGVTLA